MCNMLYEYDPNAMHVYVDVCRCAFSLFTNECFLFLKISFPCFIHVSLLCPPNKRRLLTWKYHKILWNESIFFCDECVNLWGFYLCRFVILFSILFRFISFYDIEKLNDIWHASNDILLPAFSYFFFICLDIQLMLDNLPRADTFSA